MIEKEELQLSREDISKLKKQILPVLLFPIAFAVIVYFMFSFVLNDTEGMGLDGVFTYVIIAFGLFFLGVIGYMVWSLVTDLNRGIKYRITGRVTDKRLDIKTSNSGSARHGSRTKTTRSYYVYLEEEEFKMTYADYSRVKVGDLMVMEKAPKSTLTLSLETIETREVEEVRDEERVEQRFIDAEIQELKFNEKDLEALKKIYQADLKRKAFFMAPFLFIISSFIISDYWSLLVFLFPLVLIPIVQLIKLIDRMKLYAKDKAYGHKIGVTAVVEDKLTITSNRASGKSIIKTSWKSINVAPLIYDKLNQGDKIIIFKPKYSKNPISLMGLDKQELYFV